MPSPRAVLADLKNLKLDTKKAWSAVGVNGHLKGDRTHSATVKEVSATPSAAIAEKVEVEEVSQVEPALPVVEEVVLAQEESFVVVEAEVLEEVQDTSLDAENDLFRSKKKKKLTA